MLELFVAREQVDEKAAAGVAWQGAVLCLWIAILKWLFWNVWFCETHAFSARLEFKRGVTSGLGIPQDSRIDILVSSLLPAGGENAQWCFWAENNTELITEPQSPNLQVPIRAIVSSQAVFCVR